MKLKLFVYSLLAFCLFALSSCKNGDDNYVEKYTGSYKMTIRPEFNVSYPGYGTYNMVPDSEIVTDCVITGDEKNVTVKIDRVNGVINDIVITAYCDGMGMHLDDSSYDGNIRFAADKYVECDIKLDNPNVSSPYNGTMSWESSVSGVCSVDLFGMGENIQCEVTGKISFVASEK